MLLVCHRVIVVIRYVETTSVCHQLIIKAFILHKETMEVHFSFSYLFNSFSLDKRQILRRRQRPQVPSRLSRRLIHRR